MTRATAETIEDTMTEVWVLIAETRFLFGAPADGWEVPKPMDELDPFPRKHERWARRHSIRRQLAVLADGTPCDVVTAGMYRTKRARKLLDLVRQLTTADRVPVRDEFMNINGGIGGIKAPKKSDCSVATTEHVVIEEHQRLEILLKQGTELYRQAQREYEKQRVKRIAFFRDLRVARPMAERAVERGVWEAKTLLEWINQLDWAKPKKRL